MAWGYRVLGSRRGIGIRSEGEAQGISGGSPPAMQEGRK